MYVVIKRSNTIMGNSGSYYQPVMRRGDLIEHTQLLGTNGYTIFIGKQMVNDQYGGDNQ